jgi:uncharacterized protein (DUF608 family)
MKILYVHRKPQERPHGGRHGRLCGRGARIILRVITRKPENHTKEHAMAVRNGKVRTYTGQHVSRIAFPMGGIGAGTICLSGTAAFTSVSLRHRPEVFHEPWLFAGLCVRGKTNAARIIEGPVPRWKAVFPWGESFGSSGNGLGDRLFGFPRFRQATFSSRFPFGTVRLTDRAVPVSVRVTGWSPFVPGNADSASLPVVGVEYTFANTSRRPVEMVFSLHSRNFVHAREGRSGIRSGRGSYTMWQEPVEGKPWLEGACAIATDAKGAMVDAQWFRGGWFDTKTLLWKNIAAGTPVNRPVEGDGEGREGASIYVPLKLNAGQERTVRVRIAWYVPQSHLRVGYGRKETVTGQSARYRPWYAQRFGGVDEVASYWQRHYQSLRDQTTAFTDCFYDTTLPAEVIEAIAANLSILKSPTALRQDDGRFWGWEGCCDGTGCCHGSCTHVWNYAQALPHLFPDLERTLRQTEFYENQDERGHQNFRAKLPIALNDHGFHAASDGQLGGVMKVYREWRVSGDTGWMRSLWPKVKQSLDYCISVWDPGRKGVLEEPHHNTYDIEFWGPDGMCSSFYLGALRAATLMGEELGENVSGYDELYRKGKAYLESKLFNGSYFEQHIVWKGLRAADPVEEGRKGLHQQYSPEALALLKKEGPKYQYGTGCLTDGVLGAWMALVCGVGNVLDPVKVRKHVLSVFRNNFREDLSEHVNPQRPSYALGDEGGLVVCTWPKGGALSLPFPYSTEVWTGIEYQVASHLMMIGKVEEGLRVVRALRGRHDGFKRNPYDEYECGHWYARALACYAMLQGLTGIRYDAVEKALYVEPRIRGDFRSFIATATGYGTAGVRKGKPFVDVASGSIDVRSVQYRPCRAGAGGKAAARKK